VDCPKCTHAMLPVEFGTEIKISRCEGCAGLFCDRQMLERLRAEWLVDSVLDTGSAAEGARNNQMQDIACPGCGVNMARISDKEQSQVTLDACASCDSVFLDAGELSDLKTVTLMDYLKRWISMIDK
jgi:Zn-finger nucleic acid-binding protein